MRVFNESKGEEEQFHSADGSYYKGHGNLQVVLLK